jgi:hypothetical protein
MADTRDLGKTSCENLNLREMAQNRVAQLEIVMTVPQQVRMPGSGDQIPLKKDVVWCN